MLILKFFAITQLIAFIGWYGLAPVRAPKLRLLLRTILLSFLLAPGFVIGHGYAVVPGIVAIFSRGGIIFGLLPIIAVWIILFTTGLIVQKKRGTTYADQVPIKRSLVTPPAWKSLQYGLMALVLFAGFSTHRAGGINIFTGMVGAFSISFYGRREEGGSPFTLPLIFVVPVLSAGFAIFHPSIVIPVSLLWLAAGVAGGLAGMGRRDLAFSLGAVIAIGFTVMGIDRIRAAIKYRDAPHIHIEGGVPVAIAWVILFLSLTVIFSYFAWKALKNKGK